MSFIRGVKPQIHDRMLRIADKMMILSWFYDQHIAYLNGFALAVDLNKTAPL
mgnify:CR=1 FL=1|jgi:hypothetical protein